MQYPAEPLAPTSRQLALAKVLAMRNRVPLPQALTQDRQALSHWIEDQSQQARKAPDPRSSSKQVEYAEKIAISGPRTGSKSGPKSGPKSGHRPVPDECFRDKGLMARWIDCNRQA